MIPHFRAFSNTYIEGTMSGQVSDLFIALGYYDRIKVDDPC